MPSKVYASPTGKAELVSRLISAKEATGKTFTQLSKELGLTNAYTAQLFYNQAQLKPATVQTLKKAVPGITEEDMAIMQRCPMRGFRPDIIQEPHIYRMTEAVLHYGEAIKAILNEECGDGIMSAIDMYGDLKVIEGKQGEKRFVIQLNGKFLPHVEQLEENNTAP
ncbi:hypothetical protein WJX72_005312 [[Myrmecia] bisecta]|uniref:Cyanate lyase C-terminal domain-containing protein n=1 Tax=[Myrmecia] bisecta TaxID=41462 RepID=A0AAW1PH90_9CHLO